MSSRTLLSFLFLIALPIAPARAAEKPGLPQPIIPAPFGVNIHFVEPNPAEVDALAKVGYRIIRMDFAWGGIERRRGEYDFSGYDKLVAAMSQRNIRCLFILDYANRLYDNGHAPHTDEGRAAFAKWAAAAARHFAGKNIIWELWNEPNLQQFWKPTPNAEDYAKLAHAVIDAVRGADPDAFIVGPASSGFPWAFFQTLADRGVLAKFDAISVHPYRQQPPETAAADYNRLRLLLHRASPNKHLPIISGEWGYSTGWGGMTEEKQAQYLARQWLFNMSQDIGLSIWYDWKDDGADPKEPEHHFGSVYRDLRDKPAAKAASMFAGSMGGCRNARRIATENPDDYLLMFYHTEGCSAVAAWTVGKPHQVELSVPTDVIRLYGMYSVDGPAQNLVPTQETIKLNLDNSPVYLHFEDMGASRLSFWRPAEAAPIVKAGADANIVLAMLPTPSRPTEGEFHVEVDGKVIGSKALAAGAETISIPIRLADRSRQNIPATVKFTTKNKTSLWQTARITLLVANSITAKLVPVGNTAAEVLIDNPSGDELRGELVAYAKDADRWSPATKAPLAIAKGQKHTAIRLNLPEAALAKPLYVAAIDPAGNTLLKTDPARWSPIPLAAAQPWRAWTEGDRNIAGKAAATIIDLAHAPAKGIDKAIQLDYQFAKGWRYACIAPPPDLSAISGKPRELGFFLRGDASGNTLRCRFRDQTGQTFQSTYGPIDFTGWKWITLPLDEKEHHWAGDNDGIIHYPIQIDAAALIDNASLKVDQPLQLDIAGIAVKYAE